MRISKLSMLIALSALLLMSLPAFADSWTAFSNPGDGIYIPSTTNYGGGDGSGGTLFSLGTFNFSSGMLENSVPGSWATWGCPPQTESCTPNVLYSNGATSLTLTLTASDNIAGFELEPDQFAVETFTATFHSSTGDSFQITRDVNGSGGALLFAAEDTTPGAFITSIDITNTAGDDFAIAQLRQGSATTGTTPEPSSLVLLGSGILGIGSLIRRKMSL